ncbi:MAG: 30S ribosomal protein S6, partial [Pseudomonadota bacterium]
MRHYEVVVMVHPDRSDQVKPMIDRYTQQIKDAGGQIHRQEDWGKRTLAYPIIKLKKAHYVLLNIECSQATLDELENNLRYNDAVLRTLVIREEEAINEMSHIMKESGDGRSRPPRPVRPAGREREREY